MSVDWLGLFFLLPLLAVLAGKPILAAAVTPQSDPVQIRAAYGGLTSPAGPYTTVLSVRRIGTEWGGRYSPTFRKYEVILQKQNGTREERLIGVEVTFFGTGEVRELRKAG